MHRAVIGLSSTEGDRLAHLVRGVQMLRSYGSEINVEEYSDVVEVTLTPGEPPAFTCVLQVTTEATLDGLKGICRETEWALGDEPDVLSVWILAYGPHQFEHQPRLFASVGAGRIERGMLHVYEQDDFTRLCDWGQQLMGHEIEAWGEPTP